MTPHADLVARLRAWARDERLGSGALLLEAADALAALPPPADPPDVVDGQCPRCGERDGTHAVECRSQAAQAYGYLSRLFKHCAPQCEPLPDLMGICTQIDNLIVGLRQRPADPPALVALRKRAQELALYAFQHHGDDAFLYNTLADIGGISADGAGWFPAAPPVTDTPQGWTPEYIASALAKAYPPQIQEGDVIEFAYGDDPPMFQRLQHVAAVEDWNGKLRNRVRGIYRRIYPKPAAPPQEDQ